MGAVRNGEQPGRGRRSRRELIAGATGTLGALAATTLVNAAPARAADGSAVIEGLDNTAATRRTGVFTTGNSEWGILADPNTSGKGSLGVYGHGQSFGVYGEADASGAGTGVFGSGADSGYGIFGIGGTNGGTGVGGVGFGIGAGVFGHGPSVGVLGEAETTSSGTGVQGTGAGTGTGVRGDGGHAGGDGVVAQGYGTGSGVHATGGINGAGVFAVGNPGVVAQSAGSGLTALQVYGPAAFSRSGILTIAARRSSATRAGIAMTDASLVLATIQGNVPGVTVQGVTRVAGPDGSFTVHLNKAVSARTEVAWFILN